MIIVQIKRNTDNRTRLTFLLDIITQINKYLGMFNKFICGSE